MNKRNQPAKQRQTHRQRAAGGRGGGGGGTEQDRGKGERTRGHRRQRVAVGGGGGKGVGGSGRWDGRYMVMGKIQEKNKVIVEIYICITTLLFIFFSYFCLFLLRPLKDYLTLFCNTGSVVMSCGFLLSGVLMFSHFNVFLK